MANMSYCRFQNTLIDLRDCVNALNEPGELQKLSRDEARAAREMLDLCEQYNVAYAEAEEWEDDGEDDQEEPQEHIPDHEDARDAAEPDFYDE